MLIFMSPSDGIDLCGSYKVSLNLAEQNEVSRVGHGIKINRKQSLVYVACVKGIFPVFLLPPLPTILSPFFPYPFF